MEPERFLEFFKLVGPSNSWLSLLLEAGGAPQPMIWAPWASSSVGTCGTELVRLFARLSQLPKARPSLSHRPFVQQLPQNDTSFCHVPFQCSAIEVQAKSPHRNSASSWVKEKAGLRSHQEMREPQIN